MELTQRHRPDSAGGRFVWVVSQAKAGKAEEFPARARELVAALREWGYVRQHDDPLMRAADGTFVHVFEWISEQASQLAHKDPRVRDLWKAFDPICKHVSLDSLPESGRPFPHLESIGRGK